MNAAALVWSNAPVIIGAHDTGPLIRSKNGFWLAIPTPAGWQVHPRRPDHPWRMGTPDGVAPRFIYRRRGPSLLVAEGRLNTKGRAVASRSKTGRGVVNRDDLPPGPAGQAAETAGSGAGRRTGGRRCPGADRGELGGEEVLMSAVPTKLPFAALQLQRLSGMEIG